MILTKCAHCAAQLALLSPRCVKCKTRYCDRTCQANHWRLGHSQICRTIEDGGGAEKCNADKKYKEAVAVAVEACAEDTRGQTCYICTEAVHWKTNEGLVRMCACRGTSGFAHVTCLALQAETLVAGGEGRDLSLAAKNAQWHRWRACGLCKQWYHGVVSCALGWACWKTYLGRPQRDEIRSMAMTLLGGGLHKVRAFEAALVVYEVELATARRFSPDDQRVMLTIQTNVASCLEALGRDVDTFALWRDIYVRTKELSGTTHRDTLTSADNLALFLTKRGQTAECKSMLREIIEACPPRVLDTNIDVLSLRDRYASCLFKERNCFGAAKMYRDLERAAVRTLGVAHPFTKNVQYNLEAAESNVAMILATHRWAVGLQRAWRRRRA